jgi:hypothetical protein
MNKKYPLETLLEAVKEYAQTATVVLPLNMLCWMKSTSTSRCRGHDQAVETDIGECQSNTL